MSAGAGAAHSSGSKKHLASSDSATVRAPAALRSTPVLITSPLLSASESMLHCHRLPANGQTNARSVTPPGNARSRHSAGDQTGSDGDSAAGIDTAEGTASSSIVLRREPFRD